MRSPRVEARMKERDVTARLWVSHKQEQETQASARFSNVVLPPAMES
jgi:hypothetical protein